MEIKIDNQVNSYANSMFRFEGLNDAWLNSCASYLKLLFGNSIVDKTVIDYAFGRGNWSLAFLKAGAKEVISIDASIDNVLKFDAYCKKNNINNVTVIHGNVLEKKIDVKADFIWLYGILPCIMPKDIDVFFNEVKGLLRNKQSLLYVYSYNRNSLRNLTVELCRDLHIYKNEAEFIKDNYLFLRNSKGRASDDLVAPCVNWFTETELQNILRENGVFVMRQDIDYFEFINKVTNEEFYPVQFLCGLEKSEEIILKDRVQFFAKEMDILQSLANDIFSAFKENEDRRKISIGLFNTHFSSLKNGHMIRESLIDIYIYLMRLLVQAKTFNGVKFNNLTEMHYTFICKAMIDLERKQEADALGANLFTEYLLNNRIRL